MDEFVQEIIDIKTQIIETYVQLTEAQQATILELNELSIRQNQLLHRQNATLQKLVNKLKP